LVSLDDKTYVLAGELPAPRPKAGAGRYAITLQVPLNGARARYVAVVALAPPPWAFVFADEIEVIGTIPALPGSTLPIQTGILASGAKGMQQLLAGGNRVSRFSRMEFLRMLGVFDSAGPCRTRAVVRHVIAFLAV
jgi:hypothetical protein